jgi:hypothetical protein
VEKSAFARSVEMLVTLPDERLATAELLVVLARITAANANGPAILPRSEIRPVRNLLPLLYFP